MFIVENYELAVVLCWVTMLCWGSWGNTQKLAAKTWRYELFYWDYVIGILLFSLILGLTLGSYGEAGRRFIQDLQQVSAENVQSAFIGGIIFNASNILLSASVSLAGISVAFPIGVGLALVLGVFINYFTMPKGDPVILFSGVLLIVLAIVFNGVASHKVSKASGQNSRKKGIVIAICAGILMRLLLSFRSSRHGFRELGIAYGRYDDALLRPICVCHRYLCQQLPVQYVGDEKAFYRRTGELQPVLQREFQHSLSGYLGRHYLGIGNRMQLYCCR